MPKDGHITQLLAAIGGSDRAATDELLPAVYEELRAMAQKQMAGEPPGHTLQATALVHEAYLRLVGDEGADWNSRGHFFSAAAEAMRRILVERARRYGRKKHGAGRRRVPLVKADRVAKSDSPDMVSLDKALKTLQTQDPRMYDIAMLRYFAGLSTEQTARALDISERTVVREWGYARLWLAKVISGDEAAEPDEGAGNV